MSGIEDIPETVRRFVLEKVESISQLETLLLLHRTAPRTWTADQLSTELRIDPAWAAGQLRILADRGLLVHEPSHSDEYRFEAATQDFAKTVEALAECYAHRRVSLIAFLYSRPTDRIRVLADAFRFRKED